VSSERPISQWPLGVDLSRSQTTRQLAAHGTFRNCCLPRAAAVHEKIQRRSHHSPISPTDTYPPAPGPRRNCSPYCRTIAAVGPDADCAALVDVGALGGDAMDDALS
jgi:hypothetical protein